MAVGGQQGAPRFSGSRLRAARRAVGLTQEQVSAAVGVHVTVVTRWERGERVPRVDRLRELAGLLKIQPADLTDRPVDGRTSLQELRVAAGLLQEVLAARAGLTRTKYAALERGEVAAMSGADCVALAQALGVDSDEVRAAQAVARAAFIVRVRPP